MSEALDPIPSGHLLVSEAYRRFRWEKWKGYEISPDPAAQLLQSRFFDYLDDVEHNRRQVALDKVEQIEWMAFFIAFQQGQLVGLFQRPSDPSVYELPPTSWTVDAAAARLFQTAIVDARPGEPWERYHGRTVYLNKERFDVWLEAYVAQEPEDSKPRRLVAGFLLDVANDGICTTEEIEEQAAEWGLSLSGKMPLSEWSDEALRPYPIPYRSLSEGPELADFETSTSNKTAVAGSLAPTRKRGAIKGQGAKSDEPLVQRILEMERDKGGSRSSHAKTLAVEYGATTAREQSSFVRRLQRKFRGLPPLKK